MRLLVISTLAAVATLAAVCAADEEDSEGFSLQFDGWPSEVQCHSGARSGTCGFEFMANSVMGLGRGVAVPATVGGSLGALAFAGSALAAVARRRIGNRRRARNLNLPRNFANVAAAGPSPASTPYYYNPETTQGGYDNNGGWQRSDGSDDYIANLNRAENKLQGSWSSARKSARGFFSNGLSGAARGAKSIVNRMGRGIAGVGRAGVDSVARVGEVTRSGVKRIGSGMQKLQRRMGRTYQSGWDRAKSNVNRLGLAAAGSMDAAYSGVGNGLSTIGDAATSSVARMGLGTRKTAKAVLRVGSAAKDATVKATSRMGKAISRIPSNIGMVASKATNRLGTAAQRAGKRMGHAATRVTKRLGSAVGTAASKGATVVRRIGALPSKIGSAASEAATDIGEATSRFGVAAAEAGSQVVHATARMGEVAQAASTRFGEARSSLEDGVARIGELAADSAESIGGFAEGVYDAATVVPNGVAAVAREKKVQDCLLQTICYVGSPYLNAPVEDYRSYSEEERIRRKRSGAIERAVSKYQTRDREELLGHLWADYGLQRQARALADTPQYNTLLSMDDCEVFRCDVASLGRQAYGFIKKLGVSYE